MPYNLPLLSIPAYYVLATYPHGHAIMRATKSDPKKHDNRNPKSSTNIENLKRRLSAKEFAAYERGESCHRNHLENMPLYVAAVFAGLLAEREAGKPLGLNEFVIGWMAVRVMYTVAYLTTETVKCSYARSALYFVGTFMAFGMIGRSALVLA